jgi:DMSO/TMAO reductase YedYZ molybdopterin-dependent catalytic subunit
VGRPREWTFDELTALPERSVFATVECAGNGRSFLQQKAAGVQWGAGAIGHAEWTGVPLRTVLEESGIRPDAKEVVFEGRDLGSESDHPEPMHFARSLPLGKALDPDTLLACRMNGELLDPIHGFPVRLFVPGWYGVASVKWLGRIGLIAERFQGYFQSTKYTYQRRTAQDLETLVIGPMGVKSEIIRPHDGEPVGLGATRLVGVAWAGEEAISAVQVSMDGGRSWKRANLIGPSAAYSWTMWEYLWEVAEPGEYTLLARAYSSGGKVQPMEHEPLNGGYMIHHSRPRVVQAEPGRVTTARRSDAETLVYDMNAFAEENMRLPLDVELEFAVGAGI